jgi:transposase
MDTRERNGLVMALSPQFRIEDDDRGLWTVPSQERPGRHYRVFYGSAQTCTCEDFQRHGPTCKHIWAVHWTLAKLDGGELPELDELAPADPPKPKFTRDWPAIHESRRQEKKKFMLLLADLCSGLPTKPPGEKGGRPRLPLSDIVFGLVFRVYCKTPPAAQFMHDYEDLREKGYVSTLICANSLFNYMGKDWLTEILTKMIEDSGSVLAPFEEGDFAADATGISIARYRCWRRLKEEADKRKRELSEKEMKDWVKIILMCGVRTKVVASVVTGIKGDAPSLPFLAVKTAKNFRMRRVMADGAFLSMPNLKVIDEIGAVPYIPFRDTNVGDRGGIWRQALLFFQWRRAEFDKHFNKRNIVETVFSMIKTRFEEQVTSRTDTATVNECLMKVLCHNICRVIYYISESGLEPDFRKGIDKIA